MTSHNYITGSFQSAAKLVILGMLISMSANALGQQSPSSTPTPAVVVGNQNDHVFTSIKDALSVVPDSLIVSSADISNEATITQINAHLKSALIGKQGAFTVIAQDVVKMNNGGYRIGVNKESAPEPYPFDANYSLMFDEDKAEKLSILKKGQTVTVVGAITDAILKVEPRRRPVLFIIIRHGDLAASSTTNAAPGLKSSTAPRGTTTPQPPDATGSHLVLGQGWETTMQGGSATLEDLGRLLGAYARPGTNLNGDDSMIVYPGISYLSPVRQALETLKPGTRLPSKVLLSCPGFPRDSFYYYAIDGMFEGHFNRAYVVVDRADQVASVEFVDEHPNNRQINLFNEPGWHTYDFVNNRVKAMNTLLIQHKPELFAKNAWHEASLNVNSAPQTATSYSNWTVMRVNSTLVQPTGVHQSAPKRVLQENEWFVPRPLAELILTCVQNGIR